MNILPHKSWHVRTKKNIARVRKDEAKAAEEEKEIQRRVALAAQESRTAFLRERANQRIVENGEEVPLSVPLADVADIIQKDGHVNFFQELEEGRKQEKVNSEHEAEKKKEQEDYEKKIGYLVYLGQNSGEHSKEKPWYAKVDRDKNNVEDLEKERKKFKCAEGREQTRSTEVEKSELTTEELKVVKFKDFHDPLKSIRKYMSTPGVKRKLDASAEKNSLKRRNDSVVHDHDSKPSKKSKKSKEKKKKHKHKKSSKKHKKHKKSSKTSEKDEDSEDTYSDDEQEEKRNLQALREERLERERVERKRAEIHLAKLNGVPLPEEKPKTSNYYERKASVKQRYNSQFNPHLARQNFDN